MGEKVKAEGSIWRIPNTNDAKVSFVHGQTDAVKVTKVSGDIWRLYFQPGQTPSNLSMDNLLGVEGSQIVAEPDHLALVTPTERSEA